MSVASLAVAALVPAAPAAKSRSVRHHRRYRRHGAASRRVYGSGTATVAVAAPAPLQASVDPVSGLYPGASLPLTVHVTNPAAWPVRVTASSGSGSCQVSWQTPGGTVLAAGASATLTGTVAMGVGAANSCQHASVDLAVQVDAVPAGSMVVTPGPVHKSGSSTRPPFSLTASSGPLEPGVPRRLEVTIGNSGRRADRVAWIDVTVGVASPCPAADIVVGGLRRPVTVPPRQSRTATLRIELSPTAPASCAGTQIPLELRGGSR